MGVWLQRVLLSLPPNSTVSSSHETQPSLPIICSASPVSSLISFRYNKPNKLSNIPTKFLPLSAIMGSTLKLSSSTQNPENRTIAIDRNDCIPDEAMKILKSLASKWDDTLDPNVVQVIPLKGAMTNEVYQIKWPTTTERSRKVLVRIYGKGVDVFFDRKNEIKTFEFMSQKGQGPKLLGRFSNGRVEEFIRARTLSASDLRDPGISALIAAKMREFHDLDMPGPKTVLLWERLRKWLGVAKTMCSPEDVKAFSLNTLHEEISTMEKIMTNRQRVGFCHNDLQYGNIMIDEETRSLTIIDYEYASYNPVAFDIANHFCEMAADYHTETPHILDYNKYPSKEERRRFIRAYLGCSDDGDNNHVVDQLVQEVEQYTLASHLFWGLWGIISEHVNKIDFDYLGYARQRFQQYWSKKSVLFSHQGAKK